MNENSLIMITGANGLIGSAICAKLTRENKKVLAIFHNNIPKNNNWENAIIDLEKQDCMDVFLGKNISVIIHCAAELPDDNTIEASFNAAEKNKLIDNNVFSFGKKKSIKLIYTSGTSIYGTDFKGIKDENSEITSKLQPYVKQKFDSEQILIKKYLSYVILRISAPYGINQKSNTVLNIFISKALKNEHLIYHGTGSRKQDFTHVDDVVDCIYKCIYSPKSKGVYNVASGKSISMKSLAKLVVSKVPFCKSNIVQSGKKDIQEHFNAQFDIQKAKKILNWKPIISIEEGIEGLLRNTIK